MPLNLDSQIEKLFPWDFVVTSGGRDYATRPPTIGDLLTFENAQRGNDTLLAFGRLRDMVLSLFEGEEKPSIDQPYELLMIVRGLMEHWQSWVKKNFDVTGLVSISPAKETKTQP